MSSPENILLRDDTPALVVAISQIIDDYDTLNRMRRTSLEICREAFRWEERGRKLYDAIGKLRSVALAG